MSNIDPQSKSTTNSSQKLRKLPFTHGIEIENFITDRRGDILEDGKELVAVWDQMFNGALDFFKSLTSSTTNVPEYIRNKIKRVTRKDVERHGKIIRYVQLHYQFNGQVAEINIFGPDPNISQITWLLELVTPPCEYLEELDWWVNTLYIAATNSITKGYNIQPLGFNPYQTEYRAGVTCGEHHHIGGFKNEKEKKAAYNMIRAYIPHLIALSNTSPFLDSKPSGRIILKKGEDGRTLILAPDCVRSYRLKENSGQLGPNIPEYLPYVSASFTQQDFSRYVRKEIPDDRYVDAYPFTTYGTIEFRFFDAQFDQNIRIAIIILIQALALKAVKLLHEGIPIPEVKGNTIFEHRKRAVNFGMFAKFQGDPSIEATGGLFAKYYNHNPDTGGPPGKIYESLKSLMIWLKPEFRDLEVTEEDILALLIMLWGTARIAPPISAATFMLYLFEQNHGNIANVISSLALISGRPRKSFTEILGRPDTSLTNLFSTKAAKPIKGSDTTKSALARRLQQDSRQRRKVAMAKEKARLKAKQVQVAKVQKEKFKKEREMERIRQERLRKLEQAKKPPPKPLATTRKATITPTSYISKKPMTKPKSPIVPTTKKPAVSKPPRSVPAKKPTVAEVKTTKPKSSPKKAKVSLKTKQRKPVSKPKTTMKKTTSNKKKVITTSAIKNNSKSSITTKKPAYAYASTTASSNRTKHSLIPKSSSATTKKTTSIATTRKKSTTKAVKSTAKSAPLAQLETNYETYRNSRYIQYVSIDNCPTKIDYSIFTPVVRLKWKRSILQSKINFPVIVEAEATKLEGSRFSRIGAFQENILVENAALRTDCYLPIPIDLGNNFGEFRIKITVKDSKKKDVLAIIYKTLTRTKIPRDRTNTIKQLSPPSNQVGLSKVKVAVSISKKGAKGRLILMGLSQRGVVKLYDKKTRFKGSSVTTELPITIPLSICSSRWYLYMIFSARGTSTTAHTSVAPPLSKAVNFSLSGNPPLKNTMNVGTRAEITPKLNFKVRSEIKEVDILQLESSGKVRVMKRYRLKARIKKGENFVLESFEWKAPSLRKGLFRREKEKNISFDCKITDNFGVVNNSLIGLVETPTIRIVDKK